MQQATQSVVDSITWQGAYDKAVESGAVEDAAVRQADSAVRLTQGSFAPEDISRFESGSAGARLFTMFYSFFNGQANLLGSEFAIAAENLGVRRGAGRMVFVTAMALTIPAVLSRLLRGAMAGDLRDDDEYWLDDAMSVFFGSQFSYLAAMVPGGSVVKSLGQSYGNFITDDVKYGDDRIDLSPAISVVESAARAPISVYKAIAEDGSRKRAVRDLLTLIGLASDLSAYTGAVARPLGYLADVSEGKAEPENPVDLARGLVSGRTPNR